MGCRLVQGLETMTVVLLCSIKVLNFVLPLDPDLLSV